jgi:hypothetical protein
MVSWEHNKTTLFHFVIMSKKGKWAITNVLRRLGLKSQLKTFYCVTVYSEVQNNTATLKRGKRNVCGVRGLGGGGICCSQVGEIRHSTRRSLALPLELVHISHFKCNL